MFFTRRLPITLSYCLFVLLLLKGSFASAQSCTPTYHKTYHGTGNDEAFDVVVTADSGSIVAGRTTSNNSLPDGLLLRLNTEGDILWSKTYGGIEPDELTKVRQTSDGGFIALGKTKSFGVDAGAAWLIKVDGDGNLQWSRQFNSNGQPVRARSLIQLKDGGFAAAFNTNDSTADGNGVIVRTDAVGTLIWSRIFDHGNDDGINHLHEDGNSLLAGGYATLNNRDAVLMRIDVITGAVTWARSFVQHANLNDEIVEVERTAKGLAFAASTTLPKALNGINSYMLTLFKTTGDESIYFQRRLDVSTSVTTSIEQTTIRSTVDGGFIYAANDATPVGRCNYMKITGAGLPDWKRGPDGTNERRLYGLDLFGDKGYVLAGYMRAGSNPGSNKRIQVLKTDIVGNTGSCSGVISSTLLVITDYQISPFNWNRIANTMDEVSITPLTTPLNLTITTLCSTAYCVEPDVATNDPCAATLLTHLTGSYTFLPYDMAKLSDGYLLFGYNRLHANTEPMVVRMRGDGTVAWSKTMASYMHSQEFDQVIKTSDGNFLITGRDKILINHYSYLGDLVMKMNADGDVLWSKYVRGDIYDLQSDGEGGFIGTNAYNYGAPPTPITLFRMDAAGNITWQKQLDDVTGLIYRRLVYHEGYIYAAGEFYNQFPRHVAVEKLDITGNRLWSRRFTINGYFTYSVESLDMIGDSLYLIANYSDNSQFPSKTKVAAVKMGKDGEGMNAFSLENLYFTEDPYQTLFMTARQQRVTKTFDDNFVFADRATGTSDSSVVLTKFSRTGQILWSVRYDNLNTHYVSKIRDDDGSLLILGRNFKGVKDATPWYETLFMRTDPDGRITSDGSGFCHTIPHAVQTLPMRLNFNTYMPPVQTKDGAITIVPYEVDASRPFVLNSNISCKLNGNCNAIELNGSTAICNTADTFTYYFSRNPGCTITAYWKYDTTNIKTIEKTDTSVSVKFLSPGVFSITASLLTGCSVIADTIDVTIPVTGDMLSIGADTVICEGTSILLNAGKGYTSYRWQDNSTDSTLIVTKPGIYRVTVSDVCNQTYTRQIIINPHPAIPLEIGPDRTICVNDTVHLNATSEFMNYTWGPAYNLSSQSGQMIAVTPMVDTVYVVKAEKSPGCFAYDTIRVFVNDAPPIELGRDISFCHGDSAMLDGGSGFSSYLWNSGETARQIIARAAGKYVITAITDKGCRSTDTIEVTNIWPLPIVTLDRNAELCAGTTRILRAGSFSSYKWQDGSTSSTYAARGTGRYYVQVTDVHGCAGSDTTHISKLLPTPANFLPQDTAICSYGEAEIKPHRNYSSYLWSDGNRNPTITLEKPGIYWLQVTDNKQCTGRDSMKITLKDCMMGVYIPTAFSPNGDGTNDVFRAKLFGRVKNFELSVYNRWGQVVFHTTDPSKGWDGKIATFSQLTAMFVWTCRYQIEGENPTFRKGTVTIVR